MNLKNNKGFAGIDITIGLIVLMIFIPTIFGIIFNVSQTNKEVDRKSTAVNLAVDVLEASKLKQLESVEDIEPYIKKINDVDYRVTFTVVETHEEIINIEEETENPEGKENEEQTEGGDGTENEEQSGNETENEGQAGNKTENNEETVEKQKILVSKIVNVKVEYPIGDDVKSIDISTKLKNT